LALMINFFFCILLKVHFVRWIISYDTNCFLVLESNLCTKTTLGTTKLWPFLTSGPCTEVAYTVLNILLLRPSKWWPLKPGGSYSKLVVSSGWLYFDLKLVIKNTNLKYS
jgi:hypothetical protein